MASAQQKASSGPDTHRDAFDAIVVGSGISGGWAVKELTEGGLRTLMLERGRNIVHGTDYVTEHLPSWQFPFRGLGNRRVLEEEYFIQSQAGPVSEANIHFFVNDKQNPYSWHRDGKFLWIRGYQLGGRSLTWGRQCYRWSDRDFAANQRDGMGVDWPIRYRDIAKWYDHVEAFAGISGSIERIPTLPDGLFLPPMQMNCAEQAAKSKIKASFPDRHLIIGRTAVLTVPHRGRAPCHYCGPCSRGCSVGAYFSSLSSTLPAALATGRATIRPHSIVHSIIFDEARGRAVGVRVIDGQTMRETEYFARVIFLCASALGSTQILLNSKSRRFPTGLGNSSGALGHYLMDHHCKSGASGTFREIRDKQSTGERPNGIYIPQFRNLDAKTKHKDFLRGYGYEGKGHRNSWQHATEIAGFGADWKARTREAGPWQLTLHGFGEMLPNYHNYVELNEQQKDAWGLPTLRFNCKVGDNENAMRRDMSVAAAEMLEAAGATDIRPFLDDYTPGEGIHEMGTARMGVNPRTSVLNAFNQIHEVPNVFVTDGACMTSSASQNPSLTYMALTARAANHALEELKRRNL